MVVHLILNFRAGLVVSVVDPQPGEIIVDCCAAPGGKTLFIASCLSGLGNFIKQRFHFPVSVAVLFSHLNLYVS